MCRTFKIPSHIRSLMMGTEIVPKILVSFDHLTKLVDQEDSITFYIILINSYITCINFSVYKIPN
jgi:hypothetical protein